MVKGKTNGIFSEHVEEQYLEKYGSHLPPYWREEGANIFLFEFDRMVGNRYILYPLSQEEVSVRPFRS